MIDVFGADHIATYPDVLSALDVLGYDTDRVEVVLYQFVTLVTDGEPVKMSTRTRELRHARRSDRRGGRRRDALSSF